MSQFSSPLPREGVIPVPRSFTSLVFLEFLQGFLLSIPLYSVPRGRGVREVSRVFMRASHVFTETAPIEGPWFNDPLWNPFPRKMAHHRHQVNYQITFSFLVVSIRDHRVHSFDDRQSQLASLLLWVAHHQSFRLMVTVPTTKKISWKSVKHSHPSSSYTSGKLISASFEPMPTKKAGTTVQSKERTSLKIQRIIFFRRPPTQVVL